MGSFAFISGLVIIVKTANNCKWDPIKLMFLFYMHQHFKFFVVVNIDLKMAF
jgi:hypothetical protein